MERNEWRRGGFWRYSGMIAAQLASGKRIALVSLNRTLIVWQDRPDVVWVKFERTR